METQFDCVIDRYKTASLKWDNVRSTFGVDDVLPMWVADMDFMAPAPVLEAIRQRIDHGILGYTERPDSYFAAVSEWMLKRFNWSVRKEWICFAPGVVPAISFIIQAFSSPGDKVVVQPPVYYPFMNTTQNNGRQVVYNPLKMENGRYTMDFDDLKRKLDPNVKLLLLCHPHNPGGAVWTREELTKLGQICLEHKVLVVSDEIHADLIFRGHTHIPFASISEDFAQNTLVCTAPSKTFNLAGLQTANVIVPNPKLGEVFAAQMKKVHLIRPNVFGTLATESAYKYGSAWLEELLDYLQGNMEFLVDYCETRIKQIKVMKPEGTYLVWLDCRGLGMNDEQLNQFLLTQAKVALDGGNWFGPGGEGFTRINIACPRATLEDGLKRIEQAINTYCG